jgi:hypothetical protein
MFSIQPIVDAIKSEHPELSENMAVACALMAMAEFKQKVLEGEKEKPSNSRNNSRVSGARTPNA